MASISAVVSISHQESFRNSGFTRTMKPLDTHSELIKPDFKDLVSPSKLRRLGELLRISVVSGISTVRHAGWEQPDAISIGTGLGCLADTQKFLNGYVEEDGSSALSPTPFIQSTHNTIGGLLSLLLVNHGYNMTHSQNSLSFEHALIDGLSLVHTGTKKVLVGASDEAIDELNTIGTLLNIPTDFLTSASSFFALETQDKDHVEIYACQAYEKSEDHLLQVGVFLDENGLRIEDIDLILKSGGRPLMSSDYNGDQVDYLPYTGQYFTSSALATHFAHDVIVNQSTEFGGRAIKKAPRKVLVVNNILPKKLGLTLVCQNEA